ncbi:hypothetical protein [Robertkochia flava]|uniref:hypothetical protein n=1 Tax=Robertkochia flava TaxID=3447986 RepID=UPI001CCE305B|nr:hypothetical protein [Robertkochia marina]
MRTQEEEQMDDLVRKMVRDTGLEKPVPDLKKNIMEGIRNSYSRSSYTSLIPKRGWAVLMAALVVFVAFVWYNPFGFKGMAFEIFPQNLGGLFGEPSRVTLYAVVVLGFMMAIQVVLLKRKLDLRFGKKQ